MALVRDVIYKAGPSINTFMKEERKLLNLKIVNKLTIRYDPFREDVSAIRVFSNLIYHRITTQANPKLLIKTEILSDRSEQTLTFDLKDGKQFIFKCANLKPLEIFRLINKHITPLSPVEEVASVFGTALPKTEAKKGKGRKK